jgi:polyhydroxyalkanoate synthase
LPLLVLTAAKDTIAPPASSTVLEGIVKSEDYTHLNFGCGHIGISTSSKGRREYWPQVAQWLETRSTLV